MKTYLVLFCTFFSLSIFAEEIFTVFPYVLANNDNVLTINFQTNNNLKLNISLDFKNKNSAASEVKNISDNYKSTELVKINIGTLRCDTVLNYRIKSEVSNLEVDRGLYSIPCKKSDPLYFGFLSDTQIKDEAGQKRANVLSQTVADLKKFYPFTLIINAGDVVQHGGREEEWLNYFNTAKVYLSDSIMLAAVGNHEYYDSPTYDKAPPQFLKYLRNFNSSELGYVSLDLGKISILMINSNFDFMTEQKIKEQFEWLESKIKENQAINKPVIVTMHHSPFSSSAEWVREIPTKLRADLVPILEKYPVVKMMISGHLHMYERSLKKGIHYLIAGPSGGINNYITYKNPYKVFVKSLVTTFSVFKVTDKAVEVTTFTGNKEMLDHFEVDL